MKKIAFLGLIIACMASCTTKEDPFLIQENQIGKLYKNSTVKQLDSLFAKDSLVKRIGEGDYMQAGNDQYLVFDKRGRHLLTLIPAQQHDENEKIKTIQIYDSRYKSAKGISLESTFKDIRENFTIKSIYNTISTVVITVEGQEYFTIDKKELPEDLRYDMDLNIEAIQIPDAAKIKQFAINWKHEATKDTDTKDAE
ncbi:MAG: hypothetical protein AB8B65_00075 [Kordia sp.]|uniref:hypothetical protein n=1 Tax=Kordia sp. TaxID=1965332 RepID=UPI003858E257